MLDEMIGGLLISVAAGVVLGIATLLIVYKMIDGDIPLWAGLGSMIGIMGVLLLTVRPPHPAIPGIVLVVALTLMAFFPFALHQMDKAELRVYDISRLQKAYEALRLRPDNFSAKLEIAKALEAQGLVHHAIAIASATLDTIPSDRDAVTNRSLRDQFKDEDYRVKQWMRAADKAIPLYTEHLRCQQCNHMNPLEAAICEKCGHTFLLDVAKRGDNRSKVVGKLVLAWGLLALYLVGAASIGVSFSGAVGAVILFGSLAGLGGILAWLFRRPSLV